MKLKSLSTITFGCLLTGLLAFVNKADNPIDKLVTTLQRYTDTIPQEKVYLHLDKPYYALGDTIWFKGYVTIGSRHQLSALSGAVYVDLINDKDSVVKDLKLPVTSGMVVGNFILGDAYTEGSYRIRAYTQWMRNAGPDYFYDRTFTVGDIGNRSLVTKADYQYQDVNGKQMLTALLNFTNDEGKAVAERNVRYEIIIDKKTVWAENAKTDALGSIKVNIANGNKATLAGAYIRTTFDGLGGDKYPVVRDFPIKAALSQSDVQFFPESGNLVTGITSKVAFKAVGVNGLGLPIKGSIIDDTGKQLTTFETLHAGMGHFMLHPTTGKTYIAKISFADGTTKTMALPKPLTDSYTLSVYQPGKDSVLVRINASQGLLSQPQGVNLIAQTRGEVIYRSAIKIDRPVTYVWLDKKDFPGGIAQFTLFDNNGEPLNERIAFIRGSDKMQLAIKSSKTTYGSKERIQIDLDAKDSKGKPTFGNFSVSVIDETKMPVDEDKESTIFTNLLLTSDLKGYVEQPNYYFAKETDEVNRALDNLMLTQGYRHFAWKELATIANQKPAFKVEGLGTTISGKVTTLTDQLLPKATVNLISPRAKIAKAVSTDADGHFSFDGIFLTDSIKFAVQAQGSKNSNKVKLILDSVPKLTVSPNPNLLDISTDIAQTLKTYIANGKKLDDYYEQTGQLDKVQRLREVRIRARKLAVSAFNHTGIVIPQGHADQSYKFPNTEPCATLGLCLQGNLPGITFKEYIYKEGRDSLPTLFPNYPYCRQGTNISPMLRVVLDGQLITDRQQIGDMFNNNTVDPADVIKVETARTNNALVSMLGGASLIIYTNRGALRKFFNPSMANISPKGFNKVREFYHPRYDKPGNATRIPDARTTVYWNPYLKTNVGGKTTFNFYNADGPGTYKVIVEGINADGELGRQVYRYTVDGNPVEITAPTRRPDSTKMGYITRPFNDFNKRLPVEKVYLHTDKPYYNLGDTLWFKAYVLNGADLTPTRRSGLLYVELNDDTLSNVRRVSVVIKDGVAWGQIPLLSKIFREGGYALRAYTNWMQNFGDDYLFNQRVYIGTSSAVKWLVTSDAMLSKVNNLDQVNVNLKLNRIDKLFSPIALKKMQVKLFDDWHWVYKENMQTGIDGSLKFSQLLKEKTKVNDMHLQITSLEKGDNEKVIQVPLTLVKKLDVQFLPEGGALVAGLRSTVGFKALADNGKGTLAAGVILDSAGNQVATFSTLHNGMGIFEFTPQAGKYTVRLTRPNNQTFALPAVKAAGTVMHVTNTELSDVVNINLRYTADISLNDSCYLLGTSRGTIYYAQAVDPKQPDIAIAKNLFPTGIAKFTLFKGMRPLNERAVFIDHHDGLQIKVTPNKTIYARRDSVSLAIEVKDKLGFPVTGKFSLAITDDNQVRPDSLGNTNIMTGLLIASDLKGNVEDPGYYISRKDKQAWQALDNLLLTQSWTGYDWAAMLSPQKKAPNFDVEKSIKVTGYVSNISKKPLANHQVIISSQKPSFIAATYTDAAGIYTFDKLPIIDSGSFFIQANNKNGRKIVTGNINVKNFIPAKVAAYPTPLLPWYVNTDSTIINRIKRKLEKDEGESIKLTGNVLQEVKIRETKIIKNSFWNPGYADIVYDEKDIKESAVLNLYELLQQKIPGFRVVNNWRKPYNGLAMPMRGEYRVHIAIDGWGLPIHIDDPYSAEELIAEMSAIKNVILTGLELKTTFGSARIEATVLVQLTTKNGRGWYKLPKTGTVTYRPIPLMYPKEFYSPKYNIKLPVTEPDFRSTIFWEPNLITDAEGKATVSFYTSDSADKYTVKIAGMDANGNLGDALIKINTVKVVQ